jgi:hypothetical protein
LGVNMADQKTYINNGTAVVQIGAGNLSGLGDVTITSPSNLQTLSYNSSTSKWVNAAPTGGVTQIVAGTNVTISPAGGTGAVTVNATGGASAYVRTSFTATSGQTAFTVTYAVGYLQVYLNGVLLATSDYTATSGTGFTLAVGALTGDIVEALVITTSVSGVSSIDVSGGSTGLTTTGGPITSSGTITLAGTLAVANGGTGVTTSTGSGANVLATSPTLVTPILGTPTSGTLSACTVDGTNSLGYLNVPQNAQSGAYTLVLADGGKHIYHASADAAATYTIPAASSVAFPIGTVISFLNLSANAVTIAITTDTMYLAGTGSTGSRTLAQYGIATATKVSGLSSSGIWLISGAALT